jgi:hypothetical protein
MDTITKRYLSRNTADALDRALRDGAIAVTGRSKTTWTIVAGSVTPDPLAALVADGLVDPAETPITWGESRPGPREYTGDEIDALIDEAKGDR